MPRHPFFFGFLLFSCCCLFLPLLGCSGFVFSPSTNLQTKTLPHQKKRCVNGRRRPIVPSDIVVVYNGNDYQECIERNRRIMDLGQNGKWNEILELVETEKEDLNNINWATSFSQLGRIRNLNRDDPLFRSFLIQYCDKLYEGGLDWAGIRGLSSVIHTMGRMRIDSVRSGRNNNNNDDAAIKMPRKIAAFVVKDYNARKIVREGNTQNIANICWSFGKLRYPEIASLFLAEVETQANWFVGNANPQEVANTAWACARLGIPCPKLFAAIDERAKWLVRDGSTQAVANTVWAFAKLGFAESKRLPDEIETNADSLFVAAGSRATPQTLANTAWAFATLNVTSHTGLFSAIEKRSEWLVEKGNTQAVANTAWAFATLGFDSPKLFAAIDDSAAWMIRSRNAQATANTAWAAATLGRKMPRLFGEIEKHAFWLIREDMNTQEIVNTAWAFAALGIDSSIVNAEIAKRADDDYGKPKKVDVSTTKKDVTNKAAATKEKKEDGSGGFSEMWSMDLPS